MSGLTASSAGPWMSSPPRVSLLQLSLLTPQRALLPCNSHTHTFKIKTLSNSVFTFLCLWLNTWRQVVVYSAGPGPHKGSSDSWRLFSAAGENRNRRRPRWFPPHRLATRTVYCFAARLETTAPTHENTDNTDKSFAGLLKGWLYADTNSKELYIYVLGSLIST